MGTDADTPLPSPVYVGRFAPSPTGPLHFGSLIAAAGSYLRARQAGGRWLVRIEDIDPPREVPGASDLILHALEAYGFEWDGEVVYQSRRLNRYRDALGELSDLSFVCRCSRSKIREAVQRLQLPPDRYPGNCRNLGLDPDDGGAVRVRCDRRPAFEDLLQGDCPSETGHDDFVIWRRDDLPAYQLAVTVDDAAQGVTEVVRGCDLLDTTPRQLHLIGSLNLRRPSFAHLPVAVTRDGQKLSKQTGAAPLDPAAPGPALCAAFAALGLVTAPALKYEATPELWQWATQGWSPKLLKSIRTVPAPTH